MHIIGEFVQPYSFTLLSPRLSCYILCCRERRSRWGSCKDFRIIPVAVPYPEFRE